MIREITFFMILALACVTGFLWLADLEKNMRMVRT